MPENQKIVVLIACSGKKQAERTAAAYLYTGELFSYSRQFVRACGSGIHDWHVLSAKHGLLMEDQEVDPYDCTLANMSQWERKAWNERVIREIDYLYGSDPEPVKLIVLAGMDYRGWIGEGLPWARIAIPLKGLGIGQQMAMLKRMIASANEDRAAVVAGAMPAHLRVERALAVARDSTKWSWF